MTKPKSTLNRSYSLALVGLVGILSASLLFAPIANGQIISPTGGIINNSETINISGQDPAYGISVGDGVTDITGTAINNTGTINIKGVAGAGTTAYGIYINDTSLPSGFVTLNNLGRINVDTTATNYAEVNIQQGMVNVDTYATTLRDYNTYGKVFDVQNSTTLNFNNTRFIARPGTGQGFKGFGVAHKVSDMYDNTAGGTVTGKIGSVETEIPLFKATLSGTDHTNQTITLTANINENTNPAIQEALNQFNNLVNRNDRLGLQQFLNNNKDLFEDLADDLTAEELLQLKQGLQSFVDNNPQLQDLIASLEDKEESQNESNNTADNSEMSESERLALSELETLLQGAQTEFDKYKIEENSRIFSYLLFNQLVPIVKGGGTLTAIQAMFLMSARKRIDDIGGAYTNKYYASLSLVSDAMKALQKKLKNAPQGLKSTGRYKEILQEATEMQAFIDDPESFWVDDTTTTTPTGTNSGSPMSTSEQDIAVSPFVNDFVDDVVAARLGIRQNLAPAPSWSAFVSPYGNFSSNTNGASHTDTFGVSGGFTRSFSDRFSAGVHFDFGYSKGDADNMNTNTDTFTGSLGVNANYKITPEWYVGGSITGSLSQTKNYYETGGTNTYYQADNNHGGGSFSAALNTGYTWKINENNAIVPEMGLSYVYMHTAAHDIKWNNGGDYMNMYNDAVDHNTLYGNIALRWLGNFEMENYTLKPFVSLGLRQDLTGKGMESSMTFMNTRFNSEATPDLTTVTSAVGIEFVWDRFSMNLNYNGAYGGEKTSHGGALNFSWSF